VDMDVGGVWDIVALRVRAMQVGVLRFRREVAAVSMGVMIVACLW
jgi:hypothetical protein